VTLLDPTARHLLAATATVQRSGRTPSLVAGIVRDGGLAWSAGRGRVDGRVPDDDVQYRIGSITKTVTAIAVLRLRDEGRLRLGDPLDRYVPGLPFGDRTIGQLLAHDAGIRSEAPGPWWERVPGVGWDELVARFTPGAEVLDDPGRRHHYSNLGFAALGEVVARIRARSWAEVVRDEILLPLGMTRTSYRPQGRAATGYAVHPWADVLHAEPEHDAGAMAPAGQLWSTAADLARLALLLLGDTGGVLTPATVLEMTDVGVVEGSSADGAGYGLGVQVLWSAEGRFRGHFGSMPGFQAALLVDPPERTGAVVLSNATNGPDLGLAVTLLTTMRRHEPHVADAWTPLSDPDDATVRAGLELIGPWYWGSHGYGFRLDSDGRLSALPLAGTSGSRETRFERRDDDSWVGLEGYFTGEVLRAVRDDAGAVIALDIGTFIFSRTPYDPAAPIPGNSPANRLR
jgi:CubicO group peptidase (beta-lactamase class C family)